MDPNVRDNVNENIYGESTQSIDGSQYSGSFSPNPSSMRPQFSGDFIKSLYETDDILMEIECFLRGKVRNADGEMVQMHKPVIMEEGIGLLMGDLRMHLHKINFLSNLSKDDVMRICKEMRKMLVNWLYLNWYNYKIDKSNLNRIVYNIDHAIFFSSMKSLNDLERGHLFPTTSRNEQVLIQNDTRQKRFGIF